MASIEELIAAKRAKGGPTVDPQVIASMPPVAGGGTRYTLAALNEEAAAVAAAPEGTRNDTLNMAAFRLGRYIGSGQLDGQTVTDALTRAALAAGLGEAEIASTLRSGGLAGAARPKDAPEPWEPTQAPPTTVLTPDTLATPQAEGDSDTTGENDGQGLSREEQYAQWRARQVVLQAEHLRISAEARDIVSTERYLKTWRAPESLPSLADELALPDEEVAWRITDLLPVDANALLAAQYKTGKTTMVLNLLRSMADGDAFLSALKVERPGGRVAYFNYEVSRGQMRRWMRLQGIRCPERIALLNLRGQQLPLVQPDVHKWVVEWLKANEATFWVVDPYARAFVGSGDSENDNMQAATFLDLLDQIKEEAGVRELVLVTHTGRSTDPSGRTRARGATRIDDWADERWLLTRDPDHDEDRYLEATGRDVNWPQHLLHFEPDTGHLSAGNTDRTQVRRSRLEDLVVDLVRQHPGIAARPLQEMVRERAGGASRQAIETAIADAKSGLRISGHPGPRGAKTFRVNDL